MALVKCPECNREISDSAKNCPHCGFKPNVEQNKCRNKTILWTIISVLLIVLSMGLFLYISKEKDNREQEAFCNYLQDSSMPQSYQDVRIIVSGQHDTWELIEDNAQSAIGVNYMIMNDEQNNVPFKESHIYKNWDSYFKGKNK